MLRRAGILNNILLISWILKALLILLNLLGSAESLKDRIHQENVLKLNAMNEKEIIEEQKKLFETLGQYFTHVFRNCK